MTKSDRNRAAVRDARHTTAARKARAAKAIPLTPNEQKAVIRHVTTKHDGALRRLAKR